jgi:cyanophycin synthetase
VMAHAMGVKIENIRQGLRTFDTTFFQAPGRLNVYDKLPFKVILDYGHNPAAVQAIADLVGRLEVRGRRIGVVSAPGDRRDEDIREIAQIAGKAFDHVIFRRDEDRRGRGEAEVPRMMEAAARAAGVPADHLEVIVDEVASIEAALRMAQPGDLVVVFGDNITRCWKQIIYYKGEEGRGLAEALATSDKPVVVPRVESFETQLGASTVIADERGVRLARATDD